MAFKKNSKIKLLAGSKDEGNKRRLLFILLKNIYPNMTFTVNPESFSKIDILLKKVYN